MAGDDARVTAFSFRRQALDGSAATALEAVERALGVYSSMPSGPLSIRARAPGASADDVRALELDRRAIRMRAMRTSAFLVPVDRAARVAAATAVPAERFAWIERAAGVGDGERRAVLAAVVGAATEPVTSAELRARLAERGFDARTARWTRGEAFGRVLSLLTLSGALVAVGQVSLSSNLLRYVAREAWFDGAVDPLAADAVDPPAARAWLAAEYLAAFGPARPADLAWWAGWTPEVAAAALAGHATIEVGHGLRLLERDLPSFERAAPLADTVTLVPKWDAWTMGYPLAGRGRFIDRDVHDRVFDGDGNALATILRGGRAIGAWAHRGVRGVLHADVDLFERVPAPTRAAIEAELGVIGAFLGYRDVVVRDVPTVVPNRPRIRRPLAAEPSSS